MLNNNCQNLLKAQKSNIAWYKTNFASICSQTASHVYSGLPHELSTIQDSSKCCFF